MANVEHETDLEAVADVSLEEAKKAKKHEEEKEYEEGGCSKKMEEESVEEETLAASSLKPAARSVSDPKSKIEVINHVVGQMAHMEKSDLIDFFNKTMSQFGPGKDYGVGDKSGSNQSTLDMKASHAVSSTGPKTKDPMPKLDSKNHWAEDVEEMFSGQDLSEEFKDRVSTLFEAAVGARIGVEIARLEEEYETAINERVEEIAEEMNTKLDTYLDYVVENWMKENEVAIESTLRNEIMEEFINGLHTLFSEHYMNVPTDKVDVLEALTDKVEALESKLDEAITENSDLRNVLAEKAKEDIFEELASDLALTQQEKFASLAEGIEFDGDLEVYSKKLQIVKENYFSATTSHVSNINEETFEGEVTETVSGNPEVSRYVQAIARTIKK